MSAMDTPTGVEPALKEPLPHRSDGVPADNVSEDSSSDSNDNSDVESDNSSNTESDSGSASDSDSKSSSGSQSSESSQSVMFKTPIAVLKPSIEQKSPAVVPPQVGVMSGSDQVLGSSNYNAVADEALVVEPVASLNVASPRATTPCEPPIIPSASPSFLPVHLPPIPAPVSSESAQVSNDSQDVQKTTAKGVLEAATPAPVSSTPLTSTSSEPKNTGEALIEIDFDQVELALSSTDKPAVSETGQSQIKPKAKRSGGSSKITSDSREERYLKKVLKVERALVRAEKKKKRKRAAAIKKGGKQPKSPPKKKKKRNKAKAPPSSDEDSVDSSSSSVSSSASEPASSDRIARIPTGRLLQQCALSRMKEVNSAREPDSKLTEINEALRLIDEFELNIDPDMVPGSGLPHLEKHIVSFKERYGALVRAVVKFHLLMIQKALTDKNAAINSDANSPLFLLWQFQNDFARAPSTSSYIDPAMLPNSPLLTPKIKTPKAKRSRKSKKSASRTPAKSKSGSGKRASSPKKRKRKHERGDKKSKSGNKKKKRGNSSSDVSPSYYKIATIGGSVLPLLLS